MKLKLSQFKGKTLLITGGTGSFGNAVLNRFLKTDIKEIRILSRDEKKQHDMRIKYNNPKIKFYIGDVRDFNSIVDAFCGVDFVFHAAALKQVPSCEFYPLEAIKTNVLGAENVLNASIKHNVSKVICLSTDKAVYPINAMGISKAMMEKIFIAKSRDVNSRTVICGTRYGNVMASRGSVIPLFCEQILSDKSITITDPDMTRFMMSLEESINLVLYAFLNGKQGEIFVQKAPASTIHVLAEALRDLLNKPNHPIDIIGTRHGEKLYETLITREEMVRSKDLGDYYKIAPDARDLTYNKFFEKGSKIITQAEDYHSHGTHRLSKEELKEKLLTLPYVKNLVN